MADITVDTLTTDLEYRADVKTIDKANKAINELEKSNRAAATATDVLTEQQTELTAELNDTTASLDDYRASQRKIKDAIKKTGTETKTQKLQLISLGNQIEKATQKTTSLRQQQKQLGVQKSRVSLGARKLARDQGRLAKATQRATETLRAEAAAAGEAEGGMSRLTEIIAGVAGGDLAAQAVTAVAGGVFELGREVITTGANFEILRARLKTVEGSAQGASKSFKLIQDFTATTPFQLEEVTTAFVRLKSLGLDASRKSLDAFGNLAAAQGKPILEFVEAVADATTNEFERLKEFGIKASAQGENVAFTFQGATTVVKKDAGEIQKFLKGLGETKFAGAMDEQAKTLIGVFSNFQDSLATTADSIAQLGVLDEVKLLVSDLSGAIGGSGGLGPLIADVLVTALRTVRSVLAALPQEQLIEFFAALFDVVKIVVGMFTDAASNSSGFAASLIELVTSLIEAAAAVFKIFTKISDLNDKMPDTPGILDLIVGALNIAIKAMTFFADMLVKLTELLSPLLDELGKLVDLLPRFTLFEEAGDMVKGLAVNLGLMNAELNQTGSAASAAVEALQKLAGVQVKQEKKKGKGTVGAIIGLADPVKKTIARERGSQADEKKRAAAQAKEGGAQLRDKRKQTNKRLDKPDSLSLADLESLSNDFDLTEKQRKKASKLLTARQKKRKKSGASSAKKQRQSLLSATVDKQFDKLAKQAGQREAARALSGGASVQEANQRELAKRKAVKGRLTKQFEDTGALPPGIANDIAQVANLPNIEAVGGNVAPPVISVFNQKTAITGNTFEASVTVSSTNATTGEIVGALQTAHVVTFQDLGNTISNSTSSERR